jgi:hypothetical protein
MSTFTLAQIDEVYSEVQEILSDSSHKPFVFTKYTAKQKRFAKIFVKANKTFNKNFRPTNFAWSA